MERDALSLITMDFKRGKKIVLGLTGSIASGKSTAADIFRTLGACVICSDTLAKKHYALLEDKICAYFASADKKEIADKMFKNPVQKKWLEDILHPPVLKEARDMIDTCKERIIVFDIPLLFECGFEDSFDLTLCVYTDYDLRKKRALHKFSAQDFVQRDNNQIPLEKKAQRADIVFYNNSNYRDLEEKIKKFYKLLNNELRG